MTIQTEMVRVYTVDDDGEECEAMVDPRLFDGQMLTMLGMWAARDNDLQQKWGLWQQSSWAMFRRDGESDPFMLYDDFIGPKPDVNVCGSAFCMAGQAVAQQPNWRLIYAGNYNETYADMCVQIEPTGEVSANGRPLYRDVPNSRQSISRTARELLGLAKLEAEDLFYGDNCINYIHGRINATFEARGLTPPFQHEAITSAHDWSDDTGTHECVRN